MILLAVWWGALGVSLLVLVAGIIAGAELGVMASAGKKKALLLIVPFVLPPLAFVLWGLLQGNDTYTPSYSHAAGFLLVHIDAAFKVVGLTGASPWQAWSVAAIWGALPIISALLAMFFLSREPGRSRKSFGIPAAALYFSGLLVFAPALIILGSNGYGYWSWSGKGFLLAAILGVFAADTGAYAVGRLFGKHKLAPSISPSKTWEGVLGGVAAGVAATVAVDNWLIPNGFGWAWAALLGAGIGIVSTIGDLAESYLKRKAKVKDSGTIIPGHGGILDRLDSLSPVLGLVFLGAILVQL